MRGVFSRTTQVVLAGGLLFTPVSNLGPREASAQQALPAWGRITMYFSSGALTDLREGQNDDSREFREVTTSIAWRSAEAVDGAEYAFDGRGAAYPGSERESRMSVYDGYVGYRTHGGRVGVRAGQMWINDLGGLGSFAGLLVEARKKPNQGPGVLRVGAFGGLEPNTLEFEYVPGVKKSGAYVAYDSGSMRRHVVGYVNVRNRGLTERSVMTTTNFFSFGKKVHLYQAGEYDLVGVGGNGSGRLAYFLANGRYSASSRLEFQGSYHRGRSIDTRSLALDVLQGTPISSARLQGLLFESVGGRVWVTIVPRVRATGGYSRDRSNSGEDHTNRYHLGGNAWNLAGSGVDVNVTRTAISGALRSYAAWDVSVGRPIGSRLYLTGDYSTNLSSLRLADDLGGFAIEHRPRTSRYSVSGLINLSRRYSLLLTIDRIGDAETREHRELAGLTVRF